MRQDLPKYRSVQAGIPFIPAIGTATDLGTGSTVSVAFTGNNTGSITYTAISNPGNITATGASSPITVSGLTAGTAYTFRVNASDGTNTSAYSAASNSVTPVVPTSYDSIATSSPTAANTITFSSIPSNYKHLQVRFLVNQTDGSTMRLRLNGDSSTSSYTEHQLDTNGASVSAGGNGSGIVSGIAVATANNTTGIFTTGIIDIHDYSSSSKNKTVRIFAGRERNGSGDIYLRSGLYISTTTVSSLTLYVAGANFTSGSTFALYGVKG